MVQLFIRSGSVFTGLIGGSKEAARYSYYVFKCRNPRNKPRTDAITYQL